MATIQEQVAQAKAAGYSDADIAKHLSQRPEHAEKFKAATDAGYKPEEIVAHLSGSASKQKAEPNKPYDAPAISPTAPTVEKPESSGGIVQGAGNLVAGALRGAGSIGSTLLWPIDKVTDMVVGDRKPTVEGLITGKQPLSRNEERRQAMDGALKDMGAEPDSWMYKGGKLAGEIAGTAGAGGVVGQGIVRAAPVLTRAGASAPVLQQLATAATTGGFRTGAPAAAGLKAAAANMATRVTGGAAAGGAGAGLIDPNSAGTGAVINAALPPALAGAGKIAGYAGRSLYSLAQPFTTAGQERIAGSIINKFAKGGPTALNNAEIVPGSAPTLAEATGNAGIAGLQRSARDMPQMTNRFVEREAANAGARAAAFDDVAGDAGKLDFFRASRDSAANDLYGQAAQVDVAADMTPAIKNQITQLMKRPSIVQAAKQAKEWALERGEEVSDAGSMQGLHDMKMALDDEIGAAVRAGKGGQAKALTATKDKLLGVMENISPAYREAKATYAEMSKPINQMEALQGLRLTDSKGNMTLAKVQNAIDGLQKAMAAPGVRAQKSLTTTQLGTLQSIRDDLLRQSNLGAGRSVGSNTFQNIATDNVLSTLLPGKAGEVVGGKVGHFAGQLGQLMYNKPNEAIRNRLVDLMLDPAAAKQAMDAAGRPILDGRRATSLRNLMGRTAPVAYRTAPVLSSDQ